MNPRPKSVWPAWVSPKSKALNLAMKQRLREFEALHGPVISSEYARLIDKLAQEETHGNYQDDGQGSGTENRRLYLA